MYLSCPAKRSSRLRLRDEQFLLAAGAVRLCLDDDMVFGIYGGHAGVALDDAFGCGHLGAFVVGAVALADGALAALAVFLVLAEPAA